MQALAAQNLRVKTTIQKMIVNGGKRHSLAQAMREAGYSESYARNPQKIKKTRAWQVSIDEIIPDEQIFISLKQLIEAGRIKKMLFPVDYSNKEIEYILNSNNYKIITIFREKKSVNAIYTAPDNSIRAQALDMAFRIKGLYGHSGAPQAKYNEFAHLSDKELADLIKEAKRILNKK